MSTGISIHIGLNAVDSKHYDNWNGELNGCENDARSMQAIADLLGYQSKVILTREATSKQVLEELAIAARTLTKGDILFLTYSGHGSQIPDVHGDETDGKDETWCLYDRMLIDDELYQMLSQFAPGVRVVFLSDSCHSGTMTKELPTYHSTGNNVSSRSGKSDSSPVYRLMPPEIANATYTQHQSFYGGIQRARSKKARSTIGASVLLISGCQDNQSSVEVVNHGTYHGLFTLKLLDVWDDGSFQGNYYDFYRQLLRKMPADQTPNYLMMGFPNSSFEAEPPFTISASVSRFTLSSPEENALATCKFELNIAREKNFLSLSDDQIQMFLEQEGSEVLMEAFKSLRTTSGLDRLAKGKLAKDGSASLGCTIQSNGNISCVGTVTIQF